MNRRTFRAICNETARRNAVVLWRKTVITNGIAKITPTCSLLYARKGQLLSALRRMGFLYFAAAEVTQAGILLSAEFGRGGQIHIYFDQLDADIQAGIASVVVRLLMKRRHKRIVQSDSIETICLAKGA